MRPWLLALVYVLVAHLYVSTCNSAKAGTGEDIARVAAALERIERKMGACR